MIKKMVEFNMKGKFICTDKEDCKFKTKTGLCRVRDKSCICMKYETIIKIL